MTCEEFESMGLDSGRDASLAEAERAAAASHAASCPRCAALEISWLAVRAELRALAQETVAVEAPARVEMRLKQRFRAEHRRFASHRTAVVAAWGLAAAAVLVGAVSWINWSSKNQLVAINHTAPSPVANNSSANSGNTVTNPDSAQQKSGADSQTLMADNELNDFTLLPGVLPADTDDAAILRVGIQRGELGALGLPVNEDRAGDWIQVDLLVGSDGLPQAVRLPE